MDWQFGLAGASRLQVLTACGPQSPFGGTPDAGGWDANNEKTFWPATLAPTRRESGRGKPRAGLGAAEGGGAVPMVTELNNAGARTLRGIRAGPRAWLLLLKNPLADSAHSLR